MIFLLQFSQFRAGGGNVSGVPHGYAPGYVLLKHMLPCCGVEVSGISRAEPPPPESGRIAIENQFFLPGVYPLGQEAEIPEIVGQYFQNSQFP